MQDVGRNLKGQRVGTSSRAQQLKYLKKKKKALPPNTWTNGRIQSETCFHWKI